MKQISNKEYEKYQQYLTDRLHGRNLTPEGLRMYDDYREVDYMTFRRTGPGSTIFYVWRCRR